ncbi:MAG: aminoacyl-tRNA hydrolase [Planctomycetes bacterium]|nr:aminoacyl-tRNA hydrolase [Planctomycetota bacterium]
MKLIVGLGNPGAQYRNTRHNAGFMVVERLAVRHGMDAPKEKFHAACIEGRIGNERVMLMQPLTYMNRSGLAVGEALSFYKADRDTDLLIVVDDLALPIGAVRVRKSGGSGGHNGLADIERALGTIAYPRLRLGIGEPFINGQRIAMHDYVLGAFTAEQAEPLAKGVETAADAVECFLASDLATAMNRYNPKLNTPN